MQRNAAHILLHKLYISVALISYKIQAIKNSVFTSNTYLLQNNLSHDALIIDPGLDTETIDAAISKGRIKPLAILATHGHFDHIGSVKYFQEKFQIPYYLHEKDYKLAKSANFYLKMAKIDKQIDIAIPDILFKSESEKINIETFSFNVFNYPGHSEGSCIFDFKNEIFSGDIVYKKGLGFNNFPGENKEKLRLSIKSIFETFNDNSMFYPGHGEKVLLSDIKNKNLDLINFLG